MKVLIAGCGYIGIPLGLQLIEDGHEVWGLRRNIDAMPEGLQRLAGDLTQPASLKGIPQDLDRVVFSPAANGRCDEDYRRVFVDGLHNLLHVLGPRLNRIERIVMTSSTGVYTQADGEVVDEGSTTEPTHYASQRILEGEGILLKATPAGTVVRLAGIYGPGRIRLIQSVRRGQATYKPGPPQYLNQIHRDDCVGAIRHVLMQEKAEPIYLAADSEPASRKEVLTWIARQTGSGEPRMEDASTGRMRGNKRCSNKRLLAGGYTFAYPTYREGYTALLATD